jgi:hypothetical protein
MDGSELPKQRMMNVVLWHMCRYTVEIIRKSLPPPPNPLWRNSPTRASAASFLRFLDHTQWHTAIGRTTLDKGSVRRRDHYLTAHNTGGIRIRNLGKRSAADPRLKSLRQGDRIFLKSRGNKFTCRGVRFPQRTFCSAVMLTSSCTSGEDIGETKYLRVADRIGKPVG